ncbi:MAG: M48 family peptidase [Candidatus Koribacter versatilis]|uniref:M48 family peptidase n=1 Tax=Candidatus Korobacter versatilis TaxID=658062 RepID=A0A932ENP1_9BACT|nr:M48 family peptidase [Candidatus Koribacter versatilis]
MNPRLVSIFQHCHRELRPRTPLPEIHASFYRFANVNNTIRIRGGSVYARISDLLEGAPDTVVEAIAHILLAKLYRKPIEPAQAARYRKYVSSREMASKAHLIRNMRGRKHLHGARGQTYDLHEIFDALNARFFHGLLGRPEMTWSREHARNSLGHYDPAHNTIVVSRIFDRPQVPRYAVEYLVYHEMLHLRHPVKLRGARRCVHPAALQEEERLFPELEKAKAFLKRL